MGLQQTKDQTCLHIQLAKKNTLPNRKIAELLIVEYFTATQKTFFQITTSIKFVDIFDANIVQHIASSSSLSNKQKFIRNS